MNIPLTGGCWDEEGAVYLGPGHCWREWGGGSGCSESVSELSGLWGGCVTAGTKYSSLGLFMSCLTGCRDLWWWTQWKPSNVPCCPLGHLSCRYYLLVTGFFFFFPLYLKWFLLFLKPISQVFFFSSEKYGVLDLLCILIFFFSKSELRCTVCASWRLGVKGDQELWILQHISLNFTLV